MRRFCAIALSAALVDLPARADEGLFELSWTEVAMGVHVGGRKDSLRYPVVANTTIVVGKKGVLVFDGGGYAAQGEQVLARVREITNKPVTHLVISHWHAWVFLVFWLTPSFLRSPSKMYRAITVCLI